MTSTIDLESSKNNANLAPPQLCSNSEGISCTIDSNGKDGKTSKSKHSSSKQRSDYIKQQQSRRRKWWYFNRGLQPISEAVENKDDTRATEESTVAIVRGLESNKKNTASDKRNVNSAMDDPAEPTAEGKATSIDNNSSFSQVSYSACFKLIEKFQEAVVDSAVRVIQAAFKRFRERRRFLRIRKAVTIIQRNVRKWLNTKHPCLRPAEFDRQSSDSARSDEYKESVSIEREGDFIDEDVNEEQLLETSVSADNIQDLEDTGNETSKFCESCITCLSSEGESAKDWTEECSCEHTELQEFDDCESSCSSCDIDEGFSSMDLLCCCVVAEMSGGLCHCDLPMLDFDHQDSSRLRSLSLDNGEYGAT